MEIFQLTTPTVSLEGVCTYAHVTGDDLLADTPAGVRRIDGFTFILLTRGSLEITHNTDCYSAQAPAIIDLSPSQMVGIDSPDWSSIDAYVLHVPVAFFPEMHISFSAIVSEGMINRTTPVIELRPEETAIYLHYFRLIRSVLVECVNKVLSRHIIAHLLSAMTYQTVQVYFRRLGGNGSQGKSSRASNYVQEFIKLLQLHFMNERTVGFYAKSLCISPKYLSLLVKEATGRSAADWIDRFVITEARNQLRFSGRNIQQVAYALNFPNQSSFGKFFKHLTGMSPTEFQKKK